MALATSNHACTCVTLHKARAQNVATATQTLGNAEPLFDPVNERTALRA